MSLNITVGERNQPSFNRILNRTRELIDARNTYILPHKLPNFEKRVRRLQKDNAILLDIDSNRSSEDLNRSRLDDNKEQALSRFIFGVIKEIQLGSNGNWKKIEPACRDLGHDRVRFIRRQALIWPKDEEEFIKALMWMVENASYGDKSLIQKIREATPYQSNEISHFFDLIDQRIQLRTEESKSSRNWISACEQGRIIKETERLKLQDEILTAPEDKIDRLKQLAESRQCQSIFRRLALWRLVQLAPNQDTSLFLSNLFDPLEPDEDLRVLAYEAYQHIRMVSGNPMSEDEREEEKKKALNDPSQRMRWLMSLDA